MTRNLILVGVGSCVGGISRYLTQLFVQKQFPSSIPLGTLSVNIIGCFIIGLESMPLLTRAIFYHQR